MYKISVPIVWKNIERLNKDKVAATLKEMGAERVFLAFGEYIKDEEELERLLVKYKEDVKYFKEQGFEVGEWMWTFMLQGDTKYTHITSPNGVVCKNSVCASDEGFIEFAAWYVKKIAESGVDLIMYDDDFRYSFLDDGMGCLCENHLNYMKELLGENFKLEDIKDKLITGGKNKYRSAWLKANRHYLLNFAKKMREAVNEINPEVRLGFCSCMGEWDFDGASSIEISKALAGETKPFLRLIGAPYWAVDKSWGNRLQDIIELERMERAWCDGEEIEIFAEGDTYPRPRFKCPASYLEGFDTALRADGNMDGILKYALDYVSSERHEQGYVKAHLKNKPFYDAVDEFFGDKECVGVRVFEAMRKFENMEVPKTAEDTKKIINMFFSPAARMLATNSIPSVYRGTGFATIAFGENAKYLPAENLKNGLILDLRAAQILTEKGIDVGLKKVKSEEFSSEEYYVLEDEYTNLTYNTSVYEIETDEKADIQSFFIVGEKSEIDCSFGASEKMMRKIPASYIYENKNGERFFVFAFDAYFCNEALYRQYARARQIKGNIKWLCGKSLPAEVEASPDLYTITKRGENSLAVGLWNFFADAVDEPKITLDREYKHIRFSGCSGKMNGKEVVLSELGAFSFAVFEVTD